MQLFMLLRSRSPGLSSSLIVMGGFVLSRVTGLLRDIVATSVYGTSAEAAAYRAAFSIVDLLYLVIIGGALGSSFIPIFIEVWERDGQERAWRVASAVVTWSLLVLTLASGLLFVLAPWLIQLLYGGRGFEPSTLALTTQLTRLFLLSPLLLGLGGLGMAALNARNRFGAAALAPTVYNLGIMVGALVGPAVGLGIWGMAWGVVGGALLYLLVQLPSLRSLGMRLRLERGRGIAEVGRVARQMGPRVLGQAAAHLSLVVTLALTSRLPDGAAKVAGLGYAYQLMLLPFGIFSLSLSQVAFPRLARLVAEGRRDELAADLRRTLATILWLTLPATTVLLILGFPLARLLFQRGAFDATSLAYTVEALLGYSLALPAFATSEILIRGFFAMQRTWTPVVVGMLQVALNLTLGVLLLRAGGEVGSLALAFSLANNLEALLLLLLMSRALPGIWRDRRYWHMVSVGLVGSILMGVALGWLRLNSEPWLPALQAEHAYLWSRDMLRLLLWVGATAALGAGLYLGFSVLLRVELLQTLLQRGVTSRSR